MLDVHAANEALASRQVSAAALRSTSILRSFLNLFSLVSVSANGPAIRKFVRRDLGFNLVGIHYGVILKAKSGRRAGEREHATHLSGTSNFAATGSNAERRSCARSTSNDHCHYIGQQGSIRQPKRVDTFSCRR
jgi:hypothetical protein